MTESVVKYRFQCRRRTAASWTSKNEVLRAGEIGVETDLLPNDVKAKIGDGVTAWNSLGYAVDTTASGSGSAAWGAITGTLTDQTDLAAALALKVPTSRTINGLALSANITLSASDVGADASGAAAAAQAYAIQRANHTGTQAQSTITNLVSDLAAKADLVGGVIPTAQLPAIAITEFLGSVASQAAMLALSGQRGDWCIRTDLSMVYVITGNDPTQLSDWTGMAYPTAPVLSVNGQTGPVVLSKSDVGLGSVEDTALSTWAGSTNLTTLGTVAAGTWHGSTIGVAYGGTGATDEGGARTALGLAIGTNVQAYNADLAAIAALTPSNDDILQRKAGAWANRTMAQLAADLGVPTLSADNTWTGQNTFAAGTLTASEPFAISQTWNNASVTFEGLLLNYTSMASAATSLGLKMNVDGSTVFSVQKNGLLVTTAGVKVANTQVGCANSTAGANRVQMDYSRGFEAASTRYLAWSNSNTSLGVMDTSLIRVDAAIVGIRNASTGGGALGLLEMTAPSAPSANGVYIYAEDDGSGKTRLMALFQSGAAQQVAIEP